MSDYRFQIIEHSGIPCLRVMIDIGESDLVVTHIPLEDIQAAISKENPTMKYDEMTDKDKVRLILQHVMGCFMLKETATGWRTPNLPREVTWPIAFWNPDGECWMMRDATHDPIPFDPLHDFNDAWLVLKQFYEDNQDGELFSPLAYHLGVTFYEQAYNSTVFQMNLEQLVNLTPEKLCVAILKTCGIE